MKIFKQVELKSAIEDFEFVLKFGQSDYNDWLLLEESFEFVEKFTKKYNTNLIIGLDEFGDIEKLGGYDLVKMLRSKMQVQRNVSYIFSGSYESVMNHIFASPKSPFYRFARIIYLEEIEIAAFAEYYEQKLKSEGLQINKELIDKILIFTGGHPYYSGLFLQQLILYYSEIPHVATSAFAFLLDIIMTMEKTYFENFRVRKYPQVVNNVLSY
ncbi:MAG: hypothetical protein HC906_17885 [Bacteroidales bacterium]|nr:hypothetical protein [Bacteroidales bacterium]